MLRMTVINHSTRTGQLQIFEWFLFSNYPSTLSLNFLGASSRVPLTLEQSTESRLYWFIASPIISSICFYHSLLRSGQRIIQVIIYVITHKIYLLNCPDDLQDCRGEGYKTVFIKSYHLFLKWKKLHTCVSIHECTYVCNCLGLHKISLKGFTGNTDNTGFL